MITSKQVSLIGLAGLLGLLVATQQGCGSDTSGPIASNAGAPAAGAPATGGAGAPAAGAPATGGAGAPAAGAPAGGAPAGGAPATGDGGAGGGSAGAATGGGSAGSAGSPGAGGGSAGGGGGGAVTFAQIKTLFGASCGVGMCHNASSMHLNYQTGDLHAVLTSPIPAGNRDCIGTTPVVANDPMSFLVKVVTAGGMCPMGTGNIPRMPNGCTTAGTGGKPKCLADTQIKLISDWIAAGAPS